MSPARAAADKLRPQADMLATVTLVPHVTSCCSQKNCQVDREVVTSGEGEEREFGEQGGESLGGLEHRDGPGSPP